MEEPLDGFVISRAHSSETTTLRPHLRSGGDTVRLDTPGLRLVASQRSPSMLFASIILGIDNFGLSTLFARLHPTLESLVPEVTKTRAARKSTSPRRLRFRELRSDGDAVHLDTPGCDWGGVNVPQRTHRVWEHVFFVAFANLGMHHLGLSTLFPPLHPVLECLVSRGCEDTRGTEIDIATSVAFQRMADRCDSLRFDVLVSVVTLRDSAWRFLQASSHDGDDFCEGPSREQMRLHFPLHAHERSDADAGEGTRRNQGRAQGALDGHSGQHGEERRGTDSGLDGALLGGGASLRGHLPPGAL